MCCKLFQIGVEMSADLVFRMHFSLPLPFPLSLTLHLSRVDCIFSHSSLPEFILWQHFIFNLCMSVCLCANLFLDRQALCQH